MKRLVCWVLHCPNRAGNANARLQARPQAGRSACRARRLLLEQLEERTLMSGTPTIFWDGGAGPEDRSWLNPLNWTDDRLPGPDDDVAISVPDEALTVELWPPPGTGTSIRSLSSDEDLAIYGDLLLADASTITGQLTFRDGSVHLQPGVVVELRGSDSEILGSLDVPAGATVRFGSGNYSLMGGLIAGTFDVPAGATVSLGEGGYTFADGAAVTGDGLVRLAQATVTIAGNVTIPHLRMDNLGELRGPGTLTVTRSFSWEMGVLSGTGSVVVAPTANFDLPFGSGRQLAGRQLIIQGARTWDRHSWGDGLDPNVFTTYFEANSGAPLHLDDGRFDNDGVRPTGTGVVAPGPLTDEQADALAAQIYDAMYGGLVGAGVDKEAIYRALANRTLPEVNVITAAYNVRYSTPGQPRVLREDLDSQWALWFSSTDYARLDELIKGNQPGADAAQIRGLLTSLNSDLAPVRDILYRGNLSALAAEYARLYPNDRLRYSVDSSPAEDLPPLQYDVESTFRYREANTLASPQELADFRISSTLLFQGERLASDAVVLHGLRAAVTDQTGNDPSQRLLAFLQS